MSRKEIQMGKTQKGNGNKKGRIIAESENGLLEIIELENSLLIIDLTCGLEVEFIKPDKLTDVQIKQDNQHVGARAVFNFGKGNTCWAIKYATPSLLIPDALQVRLVNEMPKYPKPGEIAVRGRTIFIQHPQMVPAIPTVNDVIGCCECMIVVQKRDGTGFFKSPVVTGGRAFWIIYWGWYAEEIKTITYCHVDKGGNIGEHIKKTVDISIEFDPPSPFPKTEIASFCPFKMDP